VVCGGCPDPAKGGFGELKNAGRLPPSPHKAFPGDRNRSEKQKRKPKFPSLTGLKKLKKEDPKTIYKKKKSPDKKGGENERPPEPRKKNPPNLKRRKRESKEWDPG